MARVVLRPEERVRVEDLGSASGTFLLADGASLDLAFQAGRYQQSRADFARAADLGVVAAKIG